MVGLRPVVEFQFIDFMANAFDMIVNFAGTNHYRWGQKVPMVMRGPSGGRVSRFGLPQRQSGGLLPPRAGPEDRLPVDASTTPTA